MQDSSVVEVHGFVGALGGETFEGFAGFVDTGFEQGLLVGGEGTEDVVYLVSAAEVVANADAKAAVVGGSQQAFDAAKSVVTAGSALFFHAEGAQGKGDVIDHYEQVL